MEKCVDSIIDANCSRISRVLKLMLFLFGQVIVFNSRHVIARINRHIAIRSKCRSGYAAVNACRGHSGCVRRGRRRCIAASTHRNVPFAFIVRLCVRIVVLQHCVDVCVCNSDADETALNMCKKQTYTFDYFAKCLARFDCDQERCRIRHRQREIIRWVAPQMHCVDAAKRVTNKEEVQCTHKRQPRYRPTARYCQM